MPLPPAFRLGPYEVVRLLGAGAMGEIYSARDTRLGRLVAVKLLPGGRASDPGHALRLRQEAVAASALNHPNVVAVHDVGTEGDVFFVVSELIEGRTLRQRLEEGRLSVELALDYASQAARGLAAAHEKGIVHRDLKPENLMLTDDGRVKIVDFGVAKLGSPLSRTDETDAFPTLAGATEPGLLLGTIAYMSPEHLRGDAVGSRSDIFALGVILHEMIAGERPFQGRTAAETMAAILRDTPAVSPEVPPGVAAVVGRCLAKDPEDRYSTAHDLVRALESAARRAAPTAAPGLEASRPTTVAVLPFSNASADPENDYFSDGLTEQLIHELTRVNGLRVLAWGSSSKLRGRDEDIHRTARELGADHLLVGSVRRAGGRVRISARLVQTATGYYLWTETYDRELEDLFAIQESIARAIAGTLEGTLIARQRPAPSTRRVDAFDLYLRGRYLWNQRTTAGLMQAVESFRRALEVDEGFALAHAGIADAYCLLAEYGILPPSEAIPAARAAVLRALELDPRSPEAHAAHALVRSMHDWEWAEGEALYRRAIELSPGYATAHHWLGLDLLAPLGRFDEAHHEVELARQLDPLSIGIMEGKPYLLMLQRRYDEAADAYREVIELDPHFWRAHTGLGRTYLLMGRFAEGLALLEEGRVIAGETPGILGAIGQGLAWSGDHPGARQVISKLEELCQTRYIPCTTFALVHSALDEPGLALDWLDRAAERHDLPLALVAAHPAYDALRGQARFTDLLDRLRLPDLAPSQSRPSPAG
jgi:serine/threonine protein kinase/tetratricopeptide (TPR) repeat protein